MSVVVSFERFLPPARYDLLPWTEARIEESADEDRHLHPDRHPHPRPRRRRPGRPRIPVVHDRARHRRRLLVPGRVRRHRRRHQHRHRPDPEQRRAPSPSPSSRTPPPPSSPPSSRSTPPRTPTALDRVLIAAAGEIVTRNRPHRPVRLGTRTRRTGQPRPRRGTVAANESPLGADRVGLGDRADPDRPRHVRPPRPRPRTVEAGSGDLPEPRRPDGRDGRHARWPSSGLPSTETEFQVTGRMNPNPTPP